jgi:hypothetical protein
MTKLSFGFSLMQGGPEGRRQSHIFSNDFLEADRLTVSLFRFGDQAARCGFRISFKRRSELQSLAPVRAAGVFTAGKN